MTEAASEAEGLARQAAERVQDAASAAQDRAADLKETGTSRLSEQLDQRTTQVGSQARTLAQSLRKSGDDLRQEGNTGAAGAAERAAERVERLGGYLEEKRGDEIVHDVEAFARRRPWALAGLGLVAGMAVARFVKASSEKRYAGPVGESYGSAR
jgi:ElaB/YqjD/DUF883 family membrane-anchored ribosome-binding protein